MVMGIWLLWRLRFALLYGDGMLVEMDEMMILVVDRIQARSSDDGDGHDIFYFQ